MHAQRISADEALFGLSASLVERAHELLEDGWVQGTWKTMVEGAPHRFCIEGALDLALEEMLGDGVARNDAWRIAEAYILDEAANQFRYGGKSIPGFNDPANRTQEQVLSVMTKAASRLWTLSIENEELGLDLDLSTMGWRTDVDEEAAQTYMSALLVSA